MTEHSRACILSVSGPDLLPDEAAFLAQAQPWGVILMGRSTISRGQTRALVEDIWAALGRPCLIFIDQEGGRVARLKAPEWPVFPPCGAYGLLHEQDAEAGEEACYLGHRLMAAELAAMGIHADCSPVLDVPVPGAHDVIGDRAFSRDPARVAQLGRAALRGLRDGGVAGVIKHMPGHGRSRADSHMELPVVSAGSNELGADFAPFEALRDAPMAMSAHIAFDSLDKGVPATLSKTVINSIIRDRIGFDGLLMTDDLGMKALGGTLAQRAERALAAGCDVVLHCAGFTKAPGDILTEMEEVVGACAPLQGRSLERAHAAQEASTHAVPFDLAEGWARLGALLPEVGAAA